MISIEQAVQIAEAFVKSKGEVYPGLYYSTIAPNVYKDCFYFDFAIVDQCGKSYDGPQQFAGAPGFIVNKSTGEIKVIAFWELSQLGLVPD